MKYSDLQFNKLILPVIAALIVWTTANGQFRVEHYTVKDGLPQTEVSCLAEDSLGYLWVGTIWGGLAKFDGSTFTTYTYPTHLPSNNVRDVLVAHDGTIWVATQKGLTRFHHEKPVHYDLSNGTSLFPRKLFASGDTLYYVLNNNQLGFVLNDSVYSQVINRRYSTIKSVGRSPSGITAICQQNGSVNELLILRNGELILRTRTAATIVYAVMEINDELQISTDAGLQKVKGGRLEEASFKDYAVFGFDSTSGRYLAMRNQQLFSINNSSEQQVVDGVKASSFLAATGFNSEDATWLATNVGLLKIHRKYLDRVAVDPPVDHSVMSMFFRTDTLWVGTVAEGVKMFRDSKLIKHLNFGTPTKNYVCFTKEGIDGSVWIGTAGGLGSYKAGKVDWVFPDMLKHVLAADFDVRGEGLIATTKGLFRLSAGGELAQVREAGASQATGVSYNPRRDEFALATDKGLAFMKGNRYFLVDLPELHEAELSCVTWLSDSQLLIGSFGRGAFLYTIGTQSVTVIERASGLTSNTVYFVLGDGSGAWIGMEQGIVYIEYDDHGKNIVFTNYGEADGFEGLETNLNAALFVRDQLHVGSVDGIYKLLTRKKRESVHPLHLSDIKLFFNKSVYDRISVGSPLKFKNDENHLTFFFNKVDKLYSEQTFYSYKLSGLDSIWSSPSKSNTATFIGLIPNRYSFQVRATDQSGTITYDQLSLEVVIQPAFYQTFGFRFLSVLVLAGVVLVSVYAYYRIRFQRKVRLQEERERERAVLRNDIARDFHDEIGNQIARLINYVNLLHLRENLSDTIYRSLQTQAKNILTGTKDFIWSLDPDNDDISNILLYLRDFGETMFQEKSIAFRFHGELPEGRIVPMGGSRQINLIFIEAMTNAFAHSNATEVDFEITSDEHQVRIELRDNGCGIPEEVLQNPQRGLENMKTRANKIKAALSIISNSTGTKVSLSVQTPRLTDNG